jgi:hypothetical protein
MKTVGDKTDLSSKLVLWIKSPLTYSTFLSSQVLYYYKEQILKEERKLFDSDIDAYATEDEFIVIAMPRGERKKTRFKTKRRYNPSPYKLAEDVCLN